MGPKENTTFDSMTVQSTVMFDAVLYVDAFLTVQSTVPFDYRRLIYVDAFPCNLLFRSTLRLQATDIR